VPWGRMHMARLCPGVLVGRRRADGAPVAVRVQVCPPARSTPSWTWTPLCSSSATTTAQVTRRARFSPTECPYKHVGHPPP
jgi:hypothetical protein